MRLLLVFPGLFLSWAFAQIPEPEIQPIGEDVWEAESAVDLRLLSWNARDFGGEGFDYDRVAVIASASDLIVLQDLRFGAGGADPIHILANLMQRRYDQTYCRAWLKLPSGIRHGFIWKQEVLGYVDVSGKLKEDCGTSSLRFKPRGQWAIIDFYTRSSKRLFALASNFIDKRPKRLDLEFSFLFRYLNLQPGSSFVVGTLPFLPSEKGLNKISTESFLPAWSAKEIRRNFRLRTKKLKMSDNFVPNIWYKNAGLLDFQVIDPRSQFPEVDANHLEASFGSQRPLRAVFSFAAIEESAQEAVDVQMRKVSRPRTSKDDKRTTVIHEEKPSEEEYETYDPAKISPQDTSKDLVKDVMEVERPVQELDQ